MADNITKIYLPGYQEEQAKRDEQYNRLKSRLDELKSDMTSIKKMLVELLKREFPDMATFTQALEELRAAVAAEKTVDDSLVTLITDLKTKIAESAGDPEALLALAADIRANAAAHGTALIVNTPADPATTNLPGVDDAAAAAAAAAAQAAAAAALEAQAKAAEEAAAAAQAQIDADAAAAADKAAADAAAAQAAADAAAAQAAADAAAAAAQAVAQAADVVADPGLAAEMAQDSPVVAQ